MKFPSMILSRAKEVNSTHFHFHFQLFFDLFSICLFLELRVSVKVVRSHCHTSVTSDDIVTGHEMYRRTMSYNEYNTWLFRVE